MAKKKKKDHLKRGRRYLMNTREIVVCKGRRVAQEQLYVTRMGEAPCGLNGNAIPNSHAKHLSNTYSIYACEVCGWNCHRVDMDEM